jgi:hypothetical protein
MTYLHSAFLAVASSALAFAEEGGVRQDLLRFSNNDQLHGSFAGIASGPKVMWARDDVKETIEISPTQVRQIVLTGGRPEKSLPKLSYAALVNGDRIPGVLKSLDSESLILETSFAGDVVIPRDHVAMMAPSPLGGRLVYHGPYDASEWKMITAAMPDGLKEVDSPDPNSDPSRWGFSGSAWYWQGARAGTALVRMEGMPDRSVLRFNIAWKNRLSFAMAFHADFKRPEPKDGDSPLNPNDIVSLPRLFGNSYVIQMNGNSVMLYRAGFDGEGKQILEMIRANNYGARFAEGDNATVELRCNRQSGDIVLFMNGEFVSQWSEGGTKDGQSLYAGKGQGFGFMVQGQGTPVRISDITMAEWNGMPDAARSLQVDDQDIVLLANGTDRFSGKVTGFRDGTVTFDGKYGSFRFPIDDLAEIRFAKSALARPADSSDGEMTIHLYPLGRVTGKPVTGTRETIKLLTPSGGEWNADLKSAVILDFNPSDSFLDDWDVQF